MERSGEERVVASVVLEIVVRPEEGYLVVSRRQGWGETEPGEPEVAGPFRDPRDATRFAQVRGGSLGGWAGRMAGVDHMARQPAGDGSEEVLADPETGLEVEGEDQAEVEC